MIFRQNKENVHIFILFKSFHPPALNAWFFLLEVIYLQGYTYYIIFQYIIIKKYNVNLFIFNLII